MSADVALVGGIVAALNAGDVDAMLESMHPDFEWTPLEASPVARVYRGHDEVRRYVEDWLSTFDGLRLELEDASDLGGRVVADVRGYGRGRASGLGLDSTFCQLWIVRDGVALSMTEHATRDEALEAG